jgi:hypothetical protein
MTFTDEIANAMATEDNEAFRAAVERFHWQSQLRGVPADEARAMVRKIIREEWSRVNAKS